MSDVIVRRLEIRGRVQGVYYRASMVEAAQRLALGGWVRNRTDGSVEAMVAGPADAVAQLIAWARRGPPAAHVVGVEVHPGDGQFDRFEARPTV